MKTRLRLCTLVAVLLVLLCGFTYFIRQSEAQGRPNRIELFLAEALLKMGARTKWAEDVMWRHTVYLFETTVKPESGTFGQSVADDHGSE